MRTLFVVSGLLLALAAPALADDMTAEERLNEARMALDTHLAKTEGVILVGTGDCSGALCLYVYVEEVSPKITRQIPAEYKGFKTKVQFAAPAAFGL